MARKTTARKAPKKGASKAKKTASAPSRADVVAAALRCAARQPWEWVSLSEIAQEAGLSLSGLSELCEDKAEILAFYGRRVDKKTLEAAGEGEPSLPPRDRLFDILMERFEILNEDRAALVSILKSFRLDPKQAVIGLPDLARSMTWMLEAAGIETAGIRGAAKVAGLSAVYLNVLLRSWVEDDSPDMSKTMAALDRNLSRAEQCANTLGL